MAVQTTIKQLLPNALATIYTGVKTTQRATTIILCNTSASSVNVSLYFVNAGDSYTTGAVFSSSPMAAHATRIMSEKVLKIGDTIQAFASTAAVIAFSTDIIDD